jgi:hypothetical protein
LPSGGGKTDNSTGLGINRHQIALCRVESRGRDTYNVVNVQTPEGFRRVP